MSSAQIKDSPKPWAVLFMTSKQHQIIPEQTEYFWTKWGARRRVRLLGNSPFWYAKVVSNR